MMGIPPEGLTELPPCANPKCKGQGRVIFGRQAFCGECAMKINEKLKADREAAIMEAFEDG